MRSQIMKQLMSDIIRTHCLGAIKVIPYLFIGFSFFVALHRLMHPRSFKNILVEVTRDKTLNLSFSISASVRKSSADAPAAIDPWPDSHRVVQLPGLRVRRHVLPEGRPDGDHR